MGVILFYHPKIENRIRFFQKNKIKRFYFWEEMVIVDEIGVDGSHFVYIQK
jgi:hypothetical protein